MQEGVVSREVQSKVLRSTLASEVGSGVGPGLQPGVDILRCNDMLISMEQTLWR